MRILADGPEKIVEYIVYLGENNTSNFDIRKNTHHHLNLVIKGENEIDNRVRVYEGIYYGTANSHICSGRKVVFDVTPYRTSKNLTYAYTGIYAGAEYEATRAALLWQDTRNLIRTVGISNNTLTVTTSGTKGNAVIGIYSSAGELLWSFHVWCTEQPQNYRFAEDALGKTYSVMDRNLGATTTALGQHSSYGLYYQWGRKDPFIGAVDAQSSEDATVYDIDGRELHFQIAPKSSGLSLDDITKTPRIFYTGMYTWFNSEESFMRLWGHCIDDVSAPVKTVYDPCPAGYRVAPYEILRIANRHGVLTSTKSEDYFTASAYNAGWALYYDGAGTDRSKIINFPSGGSRSALSSTWQVVMPETTGSIWTASCRKDFNAYFIGYNFWEIKIVPTANLMTGDNVRCVKN